MSIFNNSKEKEKETQIEETPKNEKFADRITDRIKKKDEVNVEKEKDVEKENTADKLSSFFKDEDGESAPITEIIQPSFWTKKYSGYKKKREKEKQDLNVYDILSSGAKPSIEYYVLTILSCIIATTGLIQGSTATIIGAMIVAPLMTPILATSLGVIWGDFHLIKTSVGSILKGVFWAVIISAILAFFIPIPGFSEEIISRTKPSLFDIVVAIASGTVGAYGYANKKISNTLVGIAIAVALMPPLCTIGISLGSMRWDMAVGATALFLINLISISLAGAVIFFLMKIHPQNEEKDDVIRRAASQIFLSIILLTAIAIPVGLFMYEGFMLSNIKNDLNKMILSDINESEILSLSSKKLSNGNFLIHVTVITGNKPDYDKLKQIRSDIMKNFDKIDQIKFTILKSVDIDNEE